MKYWWLIYIFLFVSCGKEVFAPQTKRASQQAEPVQVTSVNQCAKHTLIEPQVDLLYIVDNTGSTYFLNSEVKASIANTITYLDTNKFDYRIVIIPMVNPGNNPKIVVSKYAIPGVSLTNINNINVTSFFSPMTTGNAELGFLRALSFIGTNVQSNPSSSGLFRKNSNTIIVNISTEDDTDIIRDGWNVIADNYNLRRTQFQKFTKSYWLNPAHYGQTMDNGWAKLDANKLRYISVVPHSITNSYHCNVTSSRVGTRYKFMSKDLYIYSGDTDQDSRTWMDSYDLCSGNFSAIFDGINNSIESVVLGHTYNYWLIAESSCGITPGSITVDKYSGGSYLGSLGVYPSDPNGFEYIGYSSNQNTRELPTPGEPETGYFVRLHGTGKVSYPQCIVINTTAPPDYYGYLVIPQQPDLGTVSITKNGSAIPQSGTNGWSYIGYFSNKNIRVTGANDDTALSSGCHPAVNRTGHFIKLHGPAIYTNSDSIEIDYKAAPL